jgi:hypothetical protein
LTLLRHALVCLMGAGMALGQASSSPSAPALKPRPAAPPTAATTTEGPSRVAPDAPVVTITGLCEKPPASSATPSDCKTVITRAELEKTMNAVQPNMPQAAKKQFVNRLALIMTLAERGHEMGLDQGSEFDEQMRLARMQSLARLASDKIQKDATQVSESDIEAYYKAHAADYKAISFDRLYVPKQKQVDASTQKPDAPDTQKQREEGESAMQQESEKLRTRAAAGEDFKKLQQEAYDFANYKLQAPNPRMEKVRKASVAPTDVSIFELKKGDVSQVFNDPAGFMVYKIEDTETLPLASVHDEIARTLQGEKAKKAFEEVQNSVKTTLDDAYFATPAPPAPPSLKNPGGSPTAESPTEKK